MRLLIETYRNRRLLFQNHSCQNRIWKKIAADMVEFGSLHSPTACPQNGTTCAVGEFAGEGRERGERRKVLGTYLNTVHDVCVCVLRCLHIVV